MAYTFRAAAPADCEQLQALGISAYGAYRPSLTPDNWAQLYAGLKDEKLYTGLLQRAAGFVCVQDRTIVGMAFLVPGGHPTAVFRAEWSYIRMVGVHPAHHGQGIGKALTRMCIDRARAAGERFVALHTSELMDAARHIYEQAGFRRVEEIDPLFGTVYWLYLLELAAD